jgi:hypothetical protein
MEREQLKGKYDPFQVESIGTEAADNHHPVGGVPVGADQFIHVEPCVNLKPIDASLNV